MASASSTAALENRRPTLVGSRSVTVTLRVAWEASSDGGSGWSVRARRTSTDPNDSGGPTRLHNAARATAAFASTSSPGITKVTALR